MSTFLTIGTLSSRRLKSSGRVGEIRETDAVALDGIKEPGHVTVFVVEDRADDAFGQLELDVAELLPCLVPGLALVCVRGAADDRERHAAVTLARIVLTFSKWSSCSNFFSMRLSTSSWICCAVAPGQMTISRHRRHREVRVSS
jgi:hypothetical protein